MEVIMDVVNLLTLKQDHQNAQAKYWRHHEKIKKARAIFKIIEDKYIQTKDNFLELDKELAKVDGRYAVCPKKVHKGSKVRVKAKEVDLTNVDVIKNIAAGLSNTQLQDMINLLTAEHLVK
jgi:hypothetical protein